jgi:hypothetical protein
MLKHTYLKKMNRGEEKTPWNQIYRYKYGERKVSNLTAPQAHHKQ